MHGFPPGVHLIGGRNAAPYLRQLAREFYAPIIPVVVDLRRQGLSLRAIARELDRRGIKTVKNGTIGARHKYGGYWPAHKLNPDGAGRRPGPARHPHPTQTGIAQR